MNLDDPIATALWTTTRLRAGDIPHALYGGLAVAAYGVARETKDADVAVLSTEPQRVVALLASATITAEIAFDSVSFGGLLLSRITLTSGTPPAVNTVDLVAPRSARYAAAALDRALSAPLNGVEVRLLAPEDVVVFKLLSTRDRDLEDARLLLTALGPDLARGIVDAEVRDLADELPDWPVAMRWAAVAT